MVSANMTNHNLLTIGIEILFLSLTVFVYKLHTHTRYIGKKQFSIYIAGDALFFHSNVLHQSDPNDSDDRRWALIMAYNRASNNPLEYLAPPFPRYTKLDKVCIK